MLRRIEVCPTEELPPGEKTIVEVEGIPHSIGVFNVDWEYYALANVCPHQRAPLCEGVITGETTADRVGEYEFVRNGEVIQCPWHGWQFDITDGTSVFNPHKIRTRQYEASVESEADLTGTDDGEETADEEQVAEYGTTLGGEEPPVESYDVEAEDAVVVLYV